MKYEKLAVLATLVLTVVLALVMFGQRTTKASVGGPICNVPADYATIQDAVNDSGCTTINVSAGPYNESVTIGRPLTLNGPNVGISAFGSRGPEATVSSPGTTFNLTNGQNITIDGFTISGDFGVYPSTSTTGLSILNNIISGTSRAVSLDAPGDGASLLNNDLFSNTRSLHIGSGSGPHTNLKINGNRFSGPLADTGIFFSGSSTNTITGFEFKNNMLQHWANMAATITDATVSGNTVSVVGGMQIDLHNSTVSGNSFDGGGLTECIQLYGSQFGLVPSDHVTISGNTFNHCYRYAIQLSPDIHDISITGNEITNGTGDGVNTRDATLWTVPATIHINLNNITGNSNFGVNNTVSGVLDATCNWWGAVNGPGPVGPGAGDRVSMNVTFAPWLFAPAPGDCFATKKECEKFYEDKKKDFHDQQEAAKKAFEAQQKADKQAFDSSPHTKDQKKAFEECQKAEKKSFEDGQKADKEAFEQTNKANREQCKSLPK
jgi:hypothetical protein